MAIPVNLPMPEGVVLEWRKFAAAQQIPLTMLEDMEFDVHQDVLFRTLLMRLTKEVLAEHLAEDEYSASARFPLTWWDHWKEAHGWTWLGPLWMRKWPPRYTYRHATMSIEHAYIYPEHQIRRNPALGRAYRYDQITGPYWEDEQDGG